GDDVLKVALYSTNNNVLAGGTGNDQLVGGYYSDTYLFNLGDGRDTIIESDAGFGGVDVLQFGPDIKNDDIWLRQVGSNLEISLIGTQDKAVIQDWYSGVSRHVEKIKTSDGKVLLDSQVQNLVDSMASFGVDAGAERNLTAAQQAQLEAVLAANWQ
ncbi:calcium-binding protein, partial [Pseudomonas cichorii]|nr:calcium-binding protein [Pseudomonas cichorii]